MASITPPSTSPSVAELNSGPVALAGAPRPAGAPKPKPRKRVNTAEKRHQHNAIERQRRETLNGKFLVLARLLPSLAACRRPSKSAIVNGSIAHLSHQRSQRLLAAKLLRQLAAERDELFAEVNQWRQANGCQPKVGNTSAWTDEMEEVCAVEKETFGSFANEDGADDDQDDESDEMNLQKAAAVAGNLSTGLITPRSSTDLGSSQEQQINWSSSFMASTVPFATAAFMTDSVETSTSNSPVGSSHMLTPPHVDTSATTTTNDLSPHSSSAAESPASSTPQQQWTQQHLAFFQQQMQQQTMHRQHQHPHQMALGASLGPTHDLSMFLNQGNPQHVANVMASMFPQQRDLPPASPGNVDDWRKMSLNLNLNLANFGLGNGWTNEQAVGV